VIVHDSTVTLSQLESHLWESANILRGPVDAADFKTYVFPLLFKRISDVYDEEYAAALEAPR
jgi:type I restriction enzyme M protein